MDDFLQKAARVYRKPWPLLILALAVTVFFAFGMRLIKVDNDVKSMLPKNDRTRVITELYDSESNFGSSNAALIGIEAKDIFSLETLTYIKKVKDQVEDLNKSLPVRQIAVLLELTPVESSQVLDGLRSVGINDLNYQDTLVKLIRSPEALQAKFGWDEAFATKVAGAAAKVPGERLFGAYDAPLGKTQSLVNGDYIVFEDDALVSKKLVADEELTPGNIAGLKQRVSSWDSYEGTMVSKDLSLTAITVIINTQDKDIKALFNAELLKITADPPAGIKVFVSGESVITDHLGAAMAKDMPSLIPLIGLVLVAILFLCFKTVQGIVYPLLSTVLAVIWTFGLMGYLGIPLTVISSTIPVLLMAIVSAYGIHQMNHYYEDPKPGKFEVLRHNAKSVGLAILLSGLTVMIGFGSMITLDFIPIRNFGLFTAFGDMVGVLAALFILPALLMVGKAEKKAGKFVPEDEKTGFISKFLQFIKRLGKARPDRLLIATAIGALILLGGATLVKSDMDIVKFFPKDDSIRIADRVMNERMAGTKSLALILDSDLRDPVPRVGNPDSIVDLANPEVLKKVDQFAADVKARFPNVTKVTSYADVLKKMNQEMNGGDQAFYKVPDDPALLSQYLVIFSGDTKTLLTSNHDKLRIMLSMNQGSMAEIHGIALYTESYFDKDFLARNHLQALVAGGDQISYMANQTLMKGNMESIIACVVIVFLLLFFVLRNFWMSVIAIVPIFLCLVVDFGYLGFSGTELNTTTSLVSSIGIGIGVDFSIHFITWYRRELLVDRDVLAAVDRTILHKGRAILYNLIVIVGGFLVLLASKLGPMHDFGLLTALCLTVTAAGALVVVPAILRLLARKDYRFLYLGVEKADPSALRSE
jgi:hydrophobe/amphiphile efflux-3 (HAE3) family protein